MTSPPGCDLDAMLKRLTQTTASLLEGALQMAPARTLHDSSEQRNLDAIGNDYPAIADDADGPLKYLPQACHIVAR